MPCAQYEALKACCSVRRERGVDSDKLTVEDNDDNNNAEAAEDPQGDLALVKTRIHKDTIICSRESFSSAKELLNSDCQSSNELGIRY
jgi:hypothetical protein